MLQLTKVKVWQIAQRDYKFGKGKHRSLTKATYDAVGDLFRSLWGKQAGWAHSVLFAADLRTFAARLSTKLEVTEVKKEEEGADVSLETISKASILAATGVKRELTDEDKTLITIQEVSLARKVKRRRKV
jgi:N-glycosylase/DNA lyase